MKRLLLATLLLTIAASAYAQGEEQAAPSAEDQPAPSAPESQPEAGWQYTKWGMTPNQVRAASSAVVPAKFKRGESESVTGTDALLAAPYSSGQFNFQAYFLFGREDRKLCQVRLKAGRFDCAALRQTLRQKYGESVSHRVPGLALDKWRDEAGGNEINLVEAIDCTLVYSPLGEDDASGL